MTRATAALVLVGLALVCPARADDDALPIVERAFESARTNLEIAGDYVYHERLEQRRLNKRGEVKKRQSWTWDVTQLDGSEHRRLIARNDRPLYPKAAARERRKLARKIEKMRAETTGQREKRQARIETGRREGEEFLQQITRAFDFRLTGEEEVDGIATYVISAEPKDGYRPYSRETRTLTKVRGTLWISKDDHAWVKAELETIDDITWGIVFRLHEGARVRFTQRRINDEVWMTDRWYARARAKRLLVFGFHREYIASYGNFRRFTADSTEVHGAAAR